MSLLLLNPTTIYVPPVVRAIENVVVKAIAHITGGGLVDNLPRVLPDGLEARLNWGSWEVPNIFSIIEKEGPVERSEMFHTFNMGIGMVLVVAPSDGDQVLRLCKEMSVQACIVGSVEEGDQGVVIHS